MKLTLQNNHKKSLLLIGLALSLPLSARAEEAAPASEGSTPSVAATDKKPAKVQLQFRPREGEERILRMSVVQQGTQVGGKRKSNIRQIVGIDTVYRVLPKAKDGRARLRATMRATRFSQEIDGKITSRYDSAKTAKPVGETAEIFALLRGLIFVLQINADGTIDQIEGKDKIVEQMLDKMKTPKADREFLRPLMLASIQGGAFKNLGNTFASFSKDEVAVGDAWPKTDIVTTESNLIYDGKLSFSKREADVITLDLKSQIKPDPARKKGAATLPMKGTQSGYYQVEGKTGWTRRAHLEQRWNARVNDNGRPVAANAKSTRTLYLKMTFDVATLSAK